MTILNLLFFFIVGNLHTAEYSNYFREFSDTTGLSNNTLEIGEELVYVVSYSFVDLGELRFKVLEKINKNGKTYYRTMVNIDSYPGIPFVDLHDIYESNYNIDNYSDYFKAIRKYDDKYYFTTYDLNEKLHNIHVQKGLLSPYKLLG